MILSLPRWQKNILRVLAGIALVAVVALAFTAGQVSERRDRPEASSAEVGFARDMQVHHAQAVDMSMILRENTDDEELRSIAYDIALTQQQQIGQMYAWLQSWGYPQDSGGVRMAWMGAAGAAGPAADGAMAGHDMQDMDAGALMPGMATPEQMAQLAQSTGPAAEKLYLELMIAHHAAGADMAQVAADQVTTDVVRSLAAKMVAGQTAEIKTLQSLLDQL